MSSDVVEGTYLLSCYYTSNFLKRTGFTQTCVRHNTCLSRVTTVFVLSMLLHAEFLERKLQYASRHLLNHLDLRVNYCEYNLQMTLLVRQKCHALNFMKAE